MSTSSALVHKSWCHTRNLGRVLRRQSLFKRVFVLFFAAVLELGLWWLFVDGFRFLEGLGIAGGIIVSRLLSLFFLGTGTMLAVSGIVTAYATVFRSDEIPFLLVRPFPVRQIVAYKFAESTLFSSWAFVFVTLPFLAAYAWHRDLSWQFGLWSVCFAVPFLVICSALGTVVTMLAVRWVPRSRVCKRTGLLLLAVLVVLAWQGSVQTRQVLNAAQLDLTRVVPGLKLAGHRLLPSSWIAEGIAALEAGQWRRGGLYWLLAVFTAGVAWQLVEAVGVRTFYEAWQRASAGSGAARRREVMARWLDRRLAWSGQDLRALIMKDVRSFARDPMQWSQALIFFGLLALYFANLRSFRYHRLPAIWRNAITFVNVFSVSAVVCSLGSRFVFPQLSIEGQGFWILGLSPVSMERILYSKFWLAAAGLTAVSVVLMGLSSAMLHVSPDVQLVATALSAAVALAVCGLSTGLGAVFMDLRTRNPAAIVSGFGGTLNLVLSLAFMLSAIAPFALLYHLRTLQRLDILHFGQGLSLAGLWLAMLTAATVLIPLRLGRTALNNREF